MIKSFKCKETEKLFTRERSRKLPQTAAGNSQNSNAEIIGENHEQNETDSSG